MSAVSILIEQQVERSRAKGIATQRGSGGVNLAALVRQAQRQREPQGHQEQHERQREIWREPPHAPASVGRVVTRSTSRTQASAASYAAGVNGLLPYQASSKAAVSREKAGLAGVSRSRRT